MKTIPAEGIRFPEGSLREARASEFNEVMELIQAALRARVGVPQDRWVPMPAVFPNRVIAIVDGRQVSYPYTVNDENLVLLGEPTEVTKEYRPVHAPEMREAQGIFLEAKSSTRFLVCVIKSGLSGNKVMYPAAVLREAAPLFEGARVFVKSDEQHIRGGGKDFRQLIGRLTKPRFVEAGSGEGQIHAELDVLESDTVAAKLREAVEKEMADLFGLSIDAVGRERRKGRYREAVSITKVQSVDLIVEPGAGGQVIRFIEALGADDDMKLKQQMLKAIEEKAPKLYQSLDQEDDAAVLAAYREAIDEPDEGDDPEPAPGAENDVAEQIRMVEARAYAREQIASSKLPDAAKARLRTQFDGQARFTEAQVDQAIDSEREYLAKFVESGQITGLGDVDIESGEDRADKVQQRLNDFFDPEKPLQSFRECYVDMTGDRAVTGMVANCDMARLRESLGAARFAEAISSGTFADILGDSIARAMIREYQNAEGWADWRFLADVVPVTDFRTQERTRMGGYGDLPAVAEDAAYGALTSPGDDKATYAVTKRGGTETISLETIANDDVGAIRRIPVKLGRAASRTLYKFVLDLVLANPTIYDSVALFHATHNNLGAAALDATAFAAARLAMLNQTELTSGEKLGLVLRHLIVPPDLEETAFDLFVRGTNNDETFTQSRKPMVHVALHASDANNWFACADRADCPLTEIGFYGGNEDPELFVQDNPTQGSLFSNDQIKYKIRHIYSGAVVDFRGLYGAIVA